MILNKFLIYNEDNKKRALEFRKKLIDRITYAEKMVAYHLKQLGYRYTFQQVIFHDVGKFFIPDFYLTDFNIVIEVDGRHHNKEEVLIEDNKRTEILLKSGINHIIRIPNKDCSWDKRFTKYLNKKIIKALKDDRSKKL